ncbi:MAG: Flagellar hook-associated protein 1, partial [Pseudomonadota bacterium]|nr:Flagellar hook-associated protein 1 [Pseudomonadota bacterium]
MVDILRVSVTGLNAARTGMATTSHNIANVNTPYYSRQRIEQGTQTPEKYPYGYMGRGTDIESISRSIDEFVMKQMRGHTSGVSQYEELNDLTGQLSALLGDTEVGLTPDLEAFFGSLQDLADSPTSIPARQVLLDQAQTLTSRTEDINSALTDLRNAVDTGITNAVTAINDLSAGIAKINQDITLSQSAPGTQPNDLLDNRDRMLADLSELVNVQVLTQKDGSVSVFMGSGQPLVVSNSAFKLEAVQSGFDPQEITV